MKSPAFQFYPNDFLGSGKVGAMTAAEVGAYMLLLCLDWNEGGFVYDEVELARICRLSGAQFRKAWMRVSRCFVERRGRLWNPRLDQERQKQKEWREKSSKGGKRSAQRRLKGGSRVVQPTPNRPVEPKGNTLSSSLSPTPVTTTATTTRGRPTATWLTPVAAAYEQRKGAGTFPFPRAGKLFKPLHDAGNSGDEIALRLGRYIDWLDDPKYLSLAKFGETFGDYAEGEPAAFRSLAGYPEIVDQWGCMTAYGERVTRPAGLKLA